VKHGAINLLFGLVFAGGLFSVFAVPPDPGWVQTRLASRQTPATAACFSGWVTHKSLSENGVITKSSSFSSTSSSSKSQKNRKRERRRGGWATLIFQTGSEEQRSQWAFCPKTAPLPIFRQALTNFFFPMNSKLERFQF